MPRHAKRDELLCSFHKFQSSMFFNGGGQSGKWFEGRAGMLITAYLSLI